MTPKEKAQELIDKYYECDSIKHEIDGGGGINQAKEYALICVNEIIYVLFNLPRIPYNIDQTYFYRKVKEEIENN